MGSAWARAATAARRAGAVAPGVENLCGGDHGGSLGAGAALYFAGVRSWLTAPALLAAGEGFRQLAGLVLNRLSPPRMLPRMKPDCLGEGGVLVAVPTLLTGREQALAMVRHLSVLRLANPESSFPISCWRILWTGLPPKSPGMRK